MSRVPGLVLHSSIGGAPILPPCTGLLLYHKGLFTDMSLQGIYLDFSQWPQKSSTLVEPTASRISNSERISSFLRLKSQGSSHWPRSSLVKSDSMYVCLGLKSDLIRSITFVLVGVYPESRLQLLQNSQQEYSVCSRRCTFLSMCRA